MQLSYSYRAVVTVSATSDPDDIERLIEATGRPVTLVPV
jgi:hypothetical protein